MGSPTSGIHNHKRTILWGFTRFSYSKVLILYSVLLYWPYLDTGVLNSLGFFFFIYLFIFLILISGSFSHTNPGGFSWRRNLGLVQSQATSVVVLPLMVPTPVHRIPIVLLLGKESSFSYFCKFFSPLFFFLSFNKNFI